MNSDHRLKSGHSNLVYWVYRQGCIRARTRGDGFPHFYPGKECIINLPKLRFSFSSRRAPTFLFRSTLLFIGQHKNIAATASAIVFSFARGRQMTLCLLVFMNKLYLLL